LRGARCQHSSKHVGTPSLEPHLTGGATSGSWLLATNTNNPNSDPPTLGHNENSRSRRHSQSGGGGGGQDAPARSGFAAVQVESLLGLRVCVCERARARASVHACVPIPLAASAATGERQLLRIPWVLHMPSTEHAAHNTAQQRAFPRLPYAPRGCCHQTYLGSVTHFLQVLAGLGVRGLGTRGAAAHSCQSES